MIILKYESPLIDDGVCTALRNTLEKLNGVFNLKHRRRFNNMPRLPYQVLVIPYLKEDNNIRYCIFERSSPKSQIQFIAGGGEGNELPIEAAKREVFEEAGINNAIFQQLTSIGYIPTNIFSESQRETWGSDIFVIPEYSFGAELKSDIIKISDEHIGFKWVLYDEALQQLNWDSNKTALYELNCRLKANIK